MISAIGLRGTPPIVGGKICKNTDKMIRGGEKDFNCGALLGKNVGLTCGV